MFLRSCFCLLLLTVLFVGNAAGRTACRTARALDPLVSLCLDVQRVHDHDNKSKDEESARRLDEKRDRLKTLRHDLHAAERSVHEKLTENKADWKDLTELHYFTGPGSFTGLRIGACVINALADQLNIPIYDQNGKKHEIVMPEYGREANISKPRK